MTSRLALARSASMKARLWPQGFIAAVCVLGASVLGGASCSGNSGHTETPPAATEIEHAQLGPADLRLLVLTDLKGYLEPCGCTSRPLGGIDRMAAQVASLRGEGIPTVMVGAGDLFFDAPQGHGSERAGTETQEIWKAETLVQILDGMGMAAAVPGGLDMRFGASTFADLDQRATFPLLASGVSVDVPNAEDAGSADAGVDAGSATHPLALPGHIIVQAGALHVGIFGVTDMLAGAGVPEGVTAPEDLEAQARAAAAALRAEGADVVIALVRGPRRTVRRIASRVETIDFVVEGGLDEAEANPPAVVEHSAILHAGRQGQGLLVVDLHRRSETNTAGWTDVSTWTREVERTHLTGQIESLRARIAEWEHDTNVAAADLAEQRTRLAALEADAARLMHAPSAPGSAFEARLVQLDPDAARDASTQSIINAYSQRVNEHNRTAFASWLPETPAEGMPHYVGSDACASCHATEHAWWRTTPHGRAYNTLVDVHKEFNLSCVGCHVTGYLQPGGATVSHVGPLQDVGCENCHGPGSQHVESPSEATVNVHRDATESTCLGCHTPEHSDTFHYEAYRRAIVVAGHGLPAAAGH